VWNLVSYMNLYQLYVALMQQHMNSQPGQALQYHNAEMPLFQSNL
jgi:hypothetical protein